MLSTMDLPELPGKPSVVDDQVFQILYANDEAAQLQLLEESRPLDATKLLENTTFVDYLRDLEPAQQRRTTNRNPAPDLIATRLEPLLPILNSIPSGSETIQILTDLIAEIRQWRCTASSFITLDIFTRILKAFYIDTDDLVLNYLFRTWTHLHPSTFALRQTLYNNPITRDQLRLQWQLAHDTFATSTTHLQQLKSTPRVRAAIAQFREAWTKYEAEKAVKLEKERQDDIKRREEQCLKQVKRLQEKFRNEEDGTRQLGNAARRVYTAPVVEVVKRVFEVQMREFVEGADCAVLESGTESVEG